MERKGFASLVVILVIIVLLVAGGIWYWHYKSHPDVIPSAVTAPTTSTTTQQPATQIVAATTTIPSANLAQNQTSTSNLCPWSVDTTTTVGNTLVEIKNNTLLIGGVQKVSNLPGSLGLSAIQYIDSNCGDDAALWSNTPYPYDMYSNIQPSSDGKTFSFIYMRETTEPGDGYDGNLLEAGTTAAKLLVYDLSGNLVSATNLTDNGAVYSGNGAFSINILYFNGTTAYIDEVFAEAMGGASDAIVSASTGNGSVKSVINTGMSIGVIDGPSLGGALLSPDGRYLVYNGTQGFGAGFTEPNITSCLLSDDTSTPFCPVPTGDGIVSCDATNGCLSMSDLEVLDLQTGKQTLITFDTTKAYNPYAWSSDGSTALILIGHGGDPSNPAGGQYGVNGMDNYMTYNVMTGQAVINQDLNNVSSSLAALCTKDNFAVPNTPAGANANVCSYVSQLFYNND